MGCVVIHRPYRVGEMTHPCTDFEIGVGIVALVPVTVCLYGAVFLWKGSTNLTRYNLS